MPSRSGPEDLSDAVLRTAVDSGRLLLGAESALVASGGPGRLTVRAAVGGRSVPAGHVPATEREPGPDGVLRPVDLSVSLAEGVLVAPADEPADAYAIGRSTGDLRVLLVLAGVTPSPPDERIAAHLLETSSAVLAAERSAVLSSIRTSLHEREEERRRWARELHDETLQQLGALQVLLTSALPTTPADEADRSALVDTVRQATELVSGQIRNLRQLISELRPAGLDDLGLTPPLQALARRNEELSGIPVTLHVSLRYADGIIGTRLVPDVELAVYRVVQEALTNVRLHSTATRATVTVIEADDTVVAEITDDGQGFDPDRAAGFGVSGMRERAELAGGTLQVTPARPDGRGTAVRLVVPARHR